MRFVACAHRSRGPTLALVVAWIEQRRRACIFVAAAVPEVGRSVFERW